MAEMSAEVDVTVAAVEGQKSHPTAEAWRALLGWVSFLFRVLLQILQGPSWAQVISVLSSTTSSSSPDFRPVPAEDVTADAPLPLSSYEVPLEKLTVVLDLDETLVSAFETANLPTVVCGQAIDAGLKCFELECVSMDKEVEGRQKINHVTIFERPGLQEFLRQTSEFADLILFTAGLEGYAGPLVDRIDIESRFSLRLYRSATVSTGYREHVKDLSCLSKDLCRTVIVDNNPFSFLMQPLNGIPCVPFSAEQPHDDQLIGVLLPLLRYLSFQKDVRPILHEIFHMPEWFQKNGIPSSDTMG